MPQTPLTLGFAKPTFYYSGLGPAALGVADLDGDGNADVAVANQGDNTIGLFLGRGDGSLKPVSTIADPGSHPTSLAIADLNGDAKEDIAITNSASGNAYVLFAAGGGTYTPSLVPPQQGEGGPNAIAIADLNRDGKQDIAIATQSQQLLVFLNSGGGFSSFANVVMAGPCDALAIADFNGDDAPDVAVGETGQVELAYAQNGTFVAGGSVGVGSPGPILTDDFNGDGIADLAFIDKQSDSVSVILGLGGGVFSQSVAYGAGKQPDAITAADFDLNGYPDLVTANWGDNTVSVYLNRGDGSFRAEMAFPAGTSPSGVAVGDFNGDGKSDLAVSDDGSNNITILLNTSQ